MNPLFASLLHCPHDGSERLTSTGAAFQPVVCTGCAVTNAMDLVALRRGPLGVNGGGLAQGDGFGFLSGLASSSTRSEVEPVTGVAVPHANGDLGMPKIRPGLHP